MAGAWPSQARSPASSPPIRKRRAGWQVRFAADAWCLTDVPQAFLRFLRQRMRWERDALCLRVRKHGQGLSPTDHGIPFSELVHRLGYLLTHIIPTVAFPLYLIWLVSAYGAAAITVLTLVTMMYLVLDGIAALCALAMVGRPGSARLLPYVLSRQLRAAARSGPGAPVLIRQLRRPRRTDTLANDLRQRRSPLGRWIHLGLLFVFFLWLADLVIGPLLRLQADGLVVADRLSVSVPFAAQVGFTNLAGRVTEVLPVADQLPEEFRKLFQPRDRSQVARVALEDDRALPLFAKVKLSGIGWLSPGSVVRVWLERWFGLPARTGGVQASGEDGTVGWRPAQPVAGQAMDARPAQ